MLDSTKSVISSIFFKAETEGIAGVSAGVLQYYELSLGYCSVGPTSTKASTIISLFLGEPQYEELFSGMYTIPSSSVVCHGVEYLLSSTDTVYTQTTVAGVTLAATSLQVNPTTAMSAQTFYILIRSTTSQQMVATAVQLTVVDCTGETIAPINPSVEFTVNDLNQVVLLTTQQLVALFSSPTDARCSISDWHLSTVDLPDVITSGSYFDMFALASKNLGLDQLKYNS